MGFYKQNIEKSIRFSKIKKAKSYGYYCNLCRKYKQPLINYKDFTPSMIQTIEFEYSNYKRKIRESLFTT